MVPFHSGYSQVNGLPRLQEVIAYPLFPTFTTPELLVRPGSVPLAQSGDASPPSWFGQGSTGASKKAEQSQGWGVLHHKK